MQIACPRPPQHYAVPPEVLYVNDTYFVSTSIEIISNIEPTASVILKTWDLEVNEQKNEHTTIKRGAPEEEAEYQDAKNPNRWPLKDEKTNATSFYLIPHSQEHLESQTQQISTTKRLRLHSVNIMPAITNNACTWALTETEKNEQRNTQLYTTLTKAEVVSLVDREPHYQEQLTSTSD